MKLVTTAEMRGLEAPAVAAGTSEAQLLAEAGYPDAAAALDPAMLAAALDAVPAHVEREGDLRSHAIAQGLLVA